MNFINSTGYLKNSNTKYNPFNIIPGGDITMQNVDEELYAIPIKNNQPIDMVLMKPNEEYLFDSDFVIEIPKDNMKRRLPKLQNANNPYGFGNYNPYQFSDPLSGQFVNNNPFNTINPFFGNQENQYGIYGQKRQNEINNVVTNNSTEPITNNSFQLNRLSQPSYSWDDMMWRGDNKDKTGYWGSYSGSSMEDMYSSPEEIRQRLGIEENPEEQWDEISQKYQTQPITQQPEFERTNFLDFTQDPSMMYDIDLNSALFTAGQSFGFDPNVIENPEARRQAKSGNLMRGAGAVAKSLLNMGRLVGSGLGYQNRLQNWYESNSEANRRAIAGSYLYKFNKGGLFQYLKNGGKISELNPEKALTGEYITGLPEYAEENANAEVEKNEYIKHPNGDVQQVYGKKHSQGGEKINLENGSLIVSDNLKIGQENVKYFKNEFDLDVNAKDTYAKVIEKYTNKIGLKKLNDEQEQLFNKLNKILDIEDESTSNLNKQFLSEKINDIENEKKELEKTRSSFLNLVFERQENSKTPEESLPQFKEGGMFSDKRFKELCKKFNLSEEKAVEAYTRYLKGDTQNFSNGGYLPKYQQGIRYNNIDDFNTYMNDMYSWNPTYGYGDIPNTALRGRYLYDVNSIPYDEGYWEGDLSQIDLDSRYGTMQLATIDKFANTVLDYMGKRSHTKQDLDTYIDRGWVTEKQLNDLGVKTKNGKAARGVKEQNLGESVDQKIYDILNKNENQSEINDYRREGFYDNRAYYRGIEVPQVEFNSQEELDKYLKDNNIKSIQESDGTTVYKTDKEGLYFRPLIKNNTSEIPVENNPNKNNQPNSFDPSIARNKLRRMPYLPDQSVIPPNSIIPHLKAERTYERLDPVAITDEENIKEVFRSMDFVNNQLGEIPDSQRRASLSNLVANSQENLNKVITQIAMTNAQNVQQTEQFNINQSNREEDARVSDLLNFEQRQLTALAKTQADLDGYFDYNRRVRLGNFNTVNRLNMLSDLYENFDVGATGNVVFDPETQMYFTVGNNTSNNQVTTNIKEKTK